VGPFNNVVVRKNCGIFLLHHEWIFVMHDPVGGADKNERRVGRALGEWLEEILLRKHQNTNDGVVVVVAAVEPAATTREDQAHLPQTAGTTHIKIP
jgi:hypothetical protein